MDYLKLADFRQLKAFFLALNQGQFKTDSRQTSAIVMIDGIRTPVDKKHCLKLLRSFPDFQGDQFNDDGFLIRYLSNPTNLQRILGRFTTEQQLDLKKALETTAISEEISQAPAAGDTSAEQAAPVGTTAGAPAMGLPSAPSISFGRGRVISNIPHAPEVPKPEIVIANKSGVVTEPGKPSELVKASSSGKVAEPPPSKIYIANKSGVVTGEHAIPKAPAPKIPYSVKNAVKNAGSAARIGIKRGLTKVGGGLSRFLSGAGRAGGGLLGGAIGGGGRALGNFGLKAADVMANLSHQASRGGLSLKGPSSRVWVGVLIGFFILFFITGAISITTPEQQPTALAQPLAGGSISSCTFYRGGDCTAGLPFSNDSLSPIVSDVAAKVGVPAVILAGILRVETADAFTKQGSYNAAKIASDYDAHTSGLAYGIMQFTPGTFLNTFNGNKTEMQSLFGKTDVKNTIDPQSSMAPNNVLRIYSIKDSIIAAAFKIKGDKKSINQDGPWDENTVKEIAASYYGRNADGTTNYPGCGGSTQNYGNDLWRSYSGCQSTTQLAGVLASCPVQDPHTITNGTKQYPISGRGGHCDSNYTRAFPFWCPPVNDPGVSHAIDVSAKDEKSLLPVYLPTIEGKSVDWKYEQGNYTDSNVAGIGYGHDFSAVIDGHSYFLHLFHLDQNAGLKVGDIYKSSALVAKMYNMAGPHVHFTISKDGKQLEPHVPPPAGMNMCSSN